MNHIYRIVKNHKTGLWTVASEIARSAGSAASSTLVAGVSGLLLVGAPLVMAADPPLPTATVVNGSTANVYMAPNQKTTVVNIAAPSATGLSTNTYSKFNVDAGGLVLNNATVNAGVTTQSQLAGQLLANPNLVLSARIILNQVLAGGERSSLMGFTEVAGAKADVLVANLNGITCAGCGFINTDRLTMTTGMPNVGNAGGLTSVTVQNGDILVTGTGLNVSGVELLNLVARSIKLEGPVNANDLRVYAGAATHQFASSGEQGVPSSTVISSTATEAQVGSVAYAIDSTLLGGMYANTIRLVSTDAGVGVRMLGEVAATAADFTLTAAGKVEMSGKVSAARDVAVTSSVSGSAIELTNAAISAERNIQVAATQGDASVAGGQLFASNNLAISAQNLTDTATNHPQVSNNERFAGNALTVSTSGATSLSETVWRAQEHLAVNAGTLTTAPQTKLGSDNTMSLVTEGNMTLGQGQIKAQGDLSLEAKGAGVMSVSADGGQGIQTVTGKLDLKAGTLTNAGQIQAQRASALAVGTLNNSGNLLLSMQPERLDADTISVEGTLTNSGKVLSAGNSTYVASDVVNTSTGVIQSTKSTSVTANSLVNDNIISLATEAGASPTSALQISQVTNRDTIQSTGHVSLAANNLVNDSKIILQSADFHVTNTRLTTASSVIQTPGNFNLTGETLTLENHGAIVRGNLQGGGTVNVQLGSGFTNGATVYSGGDLNFNAASINNTNVGAMAAQGTMTMVAERGDLINKGALYAGRDLNLTAKGTAGDGSNGAIQNLLDFSLVDYRLLGRNWNGGDATNAWNIAGNFIEMGRDVSTYGTIDAGRSIGFTAQTVVNSSQVNAAGNIAVTAGVFLNQVQGGDSRAWTGRLDLYKSMQDAGFYSFPHKTKLDIYTKTWHEDQYFSAGNPLYDALNKPQMTANGILSIANFSDARNLGGVLQAKQIDIATAQSGATFLNDDLALQTKSYREYWEDYKKYILLGPLTSASDSRQSYSLVYTLAGRDSVPAGAAWTGDASSDARRIPTWANGTRSVDPIYGASIKANTLNASGFALTNQGSPLAPAVTPEGPGTAAANEATLPFPGLILTLPANPNGYFVPNRNPASRFLVEVNPNFNPGGSTLGSDYLTEKLGLKPDETIKRLGDDSYEAFLVQQQLIAQTGQGLLDGAANLAEVMSGLMDNAVAQAGELGLTYGQAPTAEQLGKLTENIVWMVETIVDGQKVLAPVVFLAPATVASIERGANIVADDMTLQVTALTNTGGTLEGKNSLAVTSEGDITNTSGTIKGGNVSLASTSGSIVNKTFSEGSGNDAGFQTTIGKTASIQSTGDLSLNAAKNITNLGAQMSAGGNASLNAGDAITFDTIENKTTTTATKSFGGGGLAGFETTTQTTVDQVKSGLTVGGNLQAKAANDITLAGTDANIAGDADMKAGGNLNIVARENTVTTKTKSEMAGMGVGGGVYGMTETETNSFSSRNVGSTLNIGGNANLEAEKTLTIQGSKLNVGGDTAISATDVQVLAGKDLDRSTTVTKTTSFLQIEDVGGGESSGSYAGSQSQSGSGSEAGTQASAGNGEAGASASASGSASAGASAGAGASYANSAGVTLAKTKTTTESSLSQRSVGSELNLGGNVTINAKKTVTLQGSELNAAGNVDLNAKNVQLLAAQNIEERSFKEVTARLGLYASTENQASASADASAEASGSAQAGASASQSGQSANAGASVEGSASAQAGAQAGASSSNTVDVLRVDTKESESRKVTNTGSAIRSGGNMNINVTDTLRTVGSTIEAEGDVALKAKNMIFEAALDTEYSKESTSTTRAGLYLDAGAGAEAKAEASAGAKAGASAGNSGMGAEAGASANAEAKAEAKAEAGAKVGAGIQVKDTRSTTESGSTTSVTSAIISRSGSVSRTAQGLIRDVGTTIEAATDFNQSANRIESLAAENSQFTKTTNEETTARIGVYASAGASAEAEASASASAEASAGTGSPKAEAKAEAGASAEADSEAVVGLEMSLERKVDSTSSRSTQAVTSTIRVGGNVNSDSKEATVLQGTNIEAGGAVNLSASELEIQAARNTEETTSSSETITARMAMKVGVGAKAEASAKASSEDGASANAEAGAGVRAGVEAQMGYSKEDSRDASTTAVVANISGGKININTTGKTTMEGTNLNAGAGGIQVAAESLDFKAARDTFEGSSSSLSVEASLKVQVTAGAGANTDAKANVSTDVANSSSSGSNAVVGSLNSEGGLTITTRGDTRLEGTQINVAGDTNVAAGGDVKIEAARNTFEASSLSVSVSAGFDKDKSAANLNVGVEKSNESSSEAVVSNISTGGSLNISAGRNMTLEGTNIEAGGDAQLAAGGDVTFKEARNESTSSSLSVSVGIGTESDDEENQLASKQTKTDTSKVEGSLGLGVENSRSSQAVTGSIKAGNNLTVAAGGNATFVGTDLAAGNSAQVAAGGDVNFKAAESTSSGVSFGLEASASASTEEKRRLSDEDNKGDVETKKTQEAEGSLSLGVNNATEQKGSNISAGAGGIQVSSGGNVNLQGTQMQTDGAADITAAGKVTQTAAVSTSVGFGISVSGSMKNEETTGSVPDAADDKKDDAKADAKDDAKADAKDDAKADAKDDAKADAKDDAKADAKDDAKADAKDDAKDDKAGDDKKEAAAEDKKDDEPEVEKERAGKLGSLTLSASVGVVNTTINATGGSNVRSGITPSGPIPGVAMTLRGSVQSDGSLKALVPVPGNLPAGKQVAATQPDGQPLPDWVKFDAATGAISGTPPADFSGSVSIVVGVPQADGSVRKIGVQF
ncbi:hemagglutinin repeat-containing protein [Limnohabitans sp. DCL3]|uniref:hemagglutinin repeat-containing protein n=1 Tax=Limnohabitans sp. DCL3 TaxID=3374103 RepID=UPI003A8829C2